MSWSSDQCHQKKGNTILKKDFVSYADRKVTCQENARRRRNIHHMYKGKGRFKGGKKGRSGHGRYIRATSDDGNDDNGSDDDVQESKPDYTKNIRVLMKMMSRDKKTS